MNFDEIEIDNRKDICVLKHQNQKVSLYKKSFKENQLGYSFYSNNATKEFVKCILNNLNLIGIEEDLQSRKYFIDTEDDQQFDVIFEELGFLSHTEFSHMYFKYYKCF